jgi:hypothetical protein
MRLLAVLTILFGCTPLFSQSVLSPSVHQEQSNHYKSCEVFSEAQFDSLHGFTPTAGHLRSGPAATLNRIVFGYHPYWMGGTYLNYRWDLLSDLCYFSFEVDPYSGMPLTLHNWLNAPVIDSAQVHGVKVHLCITLFEAHMALFSNPSSQQALIDTAVALVLARDAKGVNLDVEAVPSSLSSELNQFLIHFAAQFHEQLPGKMVSLAVPGIDSYGAFNLQALEPFIDLFMIMGYDYYWNGSSTAGPVDPLHSMSASFDYNLSRTVSYYQSSGIPDEKLVLGLPYYGRQWPVKEPLAPSAVNGWGTALTYASIRNNGFGNYSWGNRRWEPNSLSPYFSFQSNGWIQCFMNDVSSLGKRFDLVSQRGLAGIGIWALGYDHGYDDFWQLIQDKFTDLAPEAYQDTLYDSGGPEFSYYADENYLMTIDLPFCDELHLTFLELDLENNRDYLLVHDGRDTASPLLARLTGDIVPSVFTASQGSFTLHFISDEAVNNTGWKAIWHCGAMEVKKPQASAGLVGFYTNPVNGKLYMEFSPDVRCDAIIETYDMTGKLIRSSRISPDGTGSTVMVMDPRNEVFGAAGPYITRVVFSEGRSQSFKWIFSGQ